MKNNRMFIIVRDDFRNMGLKAAQGAHALAQYMIENPDIKTLWNNSTLIFLKTENENSLKEIINYLKHKGIIYSCFHEPDLNDELTSICCYESKGLFKNLKLFN